MVRALEEAAKGQLSIARISVKYQVPCTTLKDRVKGRVKHGTGWWKKFICSGRNSCLSDVLTPQLTYRWILSTASQSSTTMTYLKPLWIKTISTIIPDKFTILMVPTISISNYYQFLVLTHTYYILTSYIKLIEGGKRRFHV